MEDHYKHGRQYRKISCTFRDCMATFHTEKEMIKHKTYCPDHEYCVRCNEDFEDEAALFLHKMKSTRHIVCPVCGDDFKSEGGRGSHIRQMHRADQDITCVGCECKFTRAQALMSHIERDQCSVISEDVYRTRRVQKKAVKEAMDQKLGTNSLFGVAPSATSSVDGGVQINLLDDIELPPVDKKQSVIERMKALKIVEEAEDPYDLDALTEAKNFRSQKQWPTLPEDEDGDGQQEQELEDLMAFSEASFAPKAKENENEKENKDPVAASSVIGAAPTVRGTGTASAVGWGRWEALTATSRPAPSECEIQSTTSSNFRWDADQFFNSILSKYVCPCDKSFHAAKDLENHLKSGIHSAGVSRCPACLRIFKTATALVAHCESSTTRCNISQSTNFGQVMDDVSGGVIETVGHNPDGSIKFNAAPTDMDDIKSVAW